MLEQIEKLWDTVVVTIFNTVTSTYALLNLILVVMAACFGSMLFGKVKAPLKDALLRGLGVFTFLMGASQMWDGFFVLQTGQFEASGTVLVLISLLIGYFIGNAFTVERQIGRLGVWLCKLFYKKSDKKPVASQKATAKEVPSAPQAESIPSAEGFMLAALICAFSAPTIRYTVESQLIGDAVPLLIKLGFDFVVFFILAAIYGTSVVFATLPLAAMEGILFFVYTVWGGFLTNALLDQLTMIGAVILMVAGLTLGIGKKTRAARFIPAYFIPVIYALVKLLVDKLLASA